MTTAKDKIAVPVSSDAPEEIEELMAVLPLAKVPA